MNDFLNLLGIKVRDRVTGFQGVVSSVSFDLYGCVQCIVTPPTHMENGKQNLADSMWFDHKRLELLEKEPVMTRPNFKIQVGQEIGCERKSIPSNI